MEENERVDVNGVKIYPFTSFEQLLGHVDTHKGILVAINAEKILHATEQTRAIINRNIGYSDGAGAIIALKKKGYDNVAKIPGCVLCLRIIEAMQGDWKIRLTLRRFLHPFSRYLKKAYRPCLL